MNYKKMCEQTNRNLISEIIERSGIFQHDHRHGELTLYYLCPVVATESVDNGPCVNIFWDFVVLRQKLSDEILLLSNVLSTIQTD